MIHAIRRALRSQHWWLELRELQREGLWNVAVRRAIQPRILTTHPVRTASKGPVEVRVLTWRKDHLNAIWALKTFYSHSGSDFPLVIHDGGLTRGQVQLLMQHFPDARIMSGSEADQAIGHILKSYGFERSASYRLLNPSTRKLFDFFMLSDAERVVSIDSDIVFFDNPTLLTSDAPSDANLYNEDMTEWYAMPPKELEREFGFKVVPRVNSGLSSVHKTSLDFTLIDEWLRHPKLYADRWVTEQTLHAMASSRFGLRLLPPTYLVSTTRGLPQGVVCKHYPSAPRRHLYREGMPYALKRLRTSSDGSESR